MLVGKAVIENKIFVFGPYQVGINLGGPAGFIAHNLLDKPRDFFVLPQDFNEKKIKFFEKRWLRFKRNFLVPKKEKEIFKMEYDIRRTFKQLNLCNYKYIYFHSCETLYACRGLFNSQQVIILQSHSPELPSVEFQKSEYYSEARYNYIQVSEKFAFQRANIVVFPNQGCVELYSQILPQNANIKFILSGAKNNYNLRQIDTSLINQDKINLLYIGRRNNIKGFDIVLSAFREAYRKNQNINLIIIGSGEKIEEEGIIDIGFSDSPISWYNAVDYVVNANRQSYFDLSVIEAISTGVPMIMANNYGHKWFEGKSELITMFDGRVESLSDIFSSGILKKRNRNDHRNIELYENFLTDKLYYERFKMFFNQLRKGDL